jgi:LPS-assembly protein
MTFLVTQRMSRVVRIALFTSLAFVIAASARAQTPQSSIAGCKASNVQASVQEAISKEHDGKTEKIMVLTGADALSVRIDCDQMQFFANYVEIHQDSHKVIATGNVTFVSNDSRISAEKMELDTKTKTGTFYVAHGWAALGNRVDRSMFGTQEPDAQFTGKEIHKLGPKKYKIVDGAFSTCVQPTPRWQIISSSATINLDDYALLKNSVLRVKGVPLMYLPIFYYPMEEDDRSTGFLIPTYGTSTLRGQGLSNAFFWAINRSQDATFEHTWFSKAGQQFGGEYRYVLNPGSQGTATVSMLDEKTQSTGGTMTAGGSRGYRVDGGMTQNLGHGFRARANANFFTEASLEQRYQQDVSRATQSQRSFGGNISGNWREYVLSGTMDRVDFFSTQTASSRITTTGGLPRINFSRGERAIGKSPIYFGVGSEYVTITRRAGEEGETPDLDQGLTRLDVTPTVRVPFTRWPFFTINSSVGWRATYWTESLDATTGQQVDKPLTRQYFDLNAQFVGPVFTRIFNANSEGKTKFKHVIQPNFAFQRVTAFDNYNRIVLLEGPDYVVPDVFRVTYGLTNRLYAKREVSREILSVTVQQSRYTDARAAQLDAQYQNSYSTVQQPSKYSPVAVVVRVSPTDHVQGNFRTEWTPNGDAFQSFSGNGFVNTTHVMAGFGWSQQRAVSLDPTIKPEVITHYLNSSTTVKTASNKIGGTYAFNYDIHNGAFLQQRIFTYYNAQCCGFLVEYQVFNYAASVVPRDKRLNISFTLAGIGTFANLLGAFGGQAK